MHYSNRAVTVINEKHDSKHDYYSTFTIKNKQTRINEFKKGVGIVIKSKKTNTVLCQNT